MPRFGWLLAISVSSLFATSCGGPQRYVNPSREVRHRVAVWVDPASGLNVDDVLAGCAEWREKAVASIAEAVEKFALASGRAGG